MANEVVQYNNDFNQIGLRNFNSTELDILMAIFARMKNKELEILEFDFDYLKKLTKWKDNTASSFHKALENVYDKLISIRFKIGNKRKFTKFVLFTKYTIDIEKQIIQIGLNTEFRWVLNEIAKNFTKFELEEFVDFKSSYTKEFFRRIKQFNTGKWDVSLEDFKHQLNIPETYNINDIDKRIIKPILKELEKKYYLKVEKKYKKNGKGRPSVVGFIFKYKIFSTKQSINHNFSKIEELQEEKLSQYEWFEFTYNEKNCSIYSLNLDQKEGKIHLSYLQIEGDYEYIGFKILTVAAFQKLLKYKTL